MPSVNRLGYSLYVARDIGLLLAASVGPFVYYGRVLPTDVGSDLLTAPITFVSALWYSWNGNQNFGVDLGLAKGWLLPIGTFFSVLDLIKIPPYLAVKVWLAFVLFTASVSMYYLTGTIGDSLPLLKASRARLLAALVYISNPFVVLQLPTASFLVPYAMLPLQLALLARGLHSQNGTKHGVGLALTGLTVSTNPPIIMINYVALAIYGVLALSHGNHKGRHARFLLLVAAGMLLTSAWYWVPFIASLFTAGAFWSAAIAQETYHLYNQRSSFLETFRMLGRWDLYSGYQGLPYLGYAPGYLRHPLVIGATLLVPVLSLAAFLITPRSSPENAGAKGWTAYFGLLLLFAVFMAVGAYPLDQIGVTNWLYVWLYERVPFFSAFRDGHKFVGLIALAYAPLFAMTVAYLSQIASSTTKHIGAFLRSTLRTLPFALGALVALVVAFPLWTGQALDRRYQFQVPTYWDEARAWFEGQPDMFRIFTLPDQYLQAYTWGRTSFTLSVPWIDKPVIANTPSKVEQTVGGSDLVRLAYSLPNLGQPTSTLRSALALKGGFAKVLRLMNAGYVLQRNDVDWHFYEVPSPEDERAFLAAQPDLHYERSFGELDVYSVGDPLPWIYTPNRGPIVVAGDVHTLIAFSHTSYVEGKPAFLFSAYQTDEALAHAVSWGAPVLIPVISGGPLGDEPPAAEVIASLETERARVLRLLEPSGTLPIYLFFQPGSWNQTPGADLFVPRSMKFVIRADLAPVGPDGGPPQLIHLALGDRSVALSPNRYGAQDKETHVFSSEGIELEQGRYTIALGDQATADIPPIKIVEVAPEAASAIAQPSRPTIMFQRTNPVQWVVDVGEAQAPFLLVFSESSSIGWHAYVERNGRRIALGERYVANGFANSWWVTETGNYRIALEYVPQRWFNLSLATSAATIIFLLGLLVRRSSKS